MAYTAESDCQSSSFQYTVDFIGATLDCSTATVTIVDGLTTAIDYAVGQTLVEAPLESMFVIEPVECESSITISHTFDPEPTDTGFMTCTVLHCTFHTDNVAMGHDLDSYATPMTY